MWKSFKEQTKFVKFAIVVIVIGLALYLIATTIKPFKEGMFFWNKTNYEQSGQIGDFVAGVVGTLFAFAGTILIILTFREQNKESKSEAALLLLKHKIDYVKHPNIRPICSPENFVKPNSVSCMKHLFKFIVYNTIINLV